MMLISTLQFLRGGRSRRSWFAAFVLPLTLAAQSPADTARTSPEPLLGIRLGGSRAATRNYLLSRGWTTVSDSVAGAVGTPALFSGRIDGRSAEIIAMFGETTSRDRMTHLLIAFTATNDSSLHDTFAWAYRRMEGLRCRADLTPDYRAQLDSVLRGRRIGTKMRGAAGAPLIAGHSMIVANLNMDWPTPTWLTTRADIGTQLSAADVSLDGKGPYQVTLWSGVLFTAMGEPTVCPDTRAFMAENRRRSMRAAAPGEKTVIDTVTVVVSKGVRGRIDTVAVETSAQPAEEMKEIHLPRARGTKIGYTFAPDTASESLMVVLDEDSVAARGSLTIQGNHVMLVASEPKVVIPPQTKKLVEILRAQLVSKNPIREYVEMECEMERLAKTYPSDWQRLVAEANRVAIDPIRDRKARARIDDALFGHGFSGCAKDRERYGVKP